MKSHFVHDRTLDTYFRTPDGQQPEPSAKDRTEADLYEQHEACHIGQQFYGPDGHGQGKWEIIEATAREVAAVNGRKGGQAKTAKQDRARMRNAQHAGWRHRVCKACGVGVIPREAPADVHLCEECGKV